MIALWICIGAVVALALIFLFLYWSDNAIKVTKYTFKAPQKLKIVHLSDLHAKNFGKDNKRLIAKIENICPDVIFFTGDAIHRYNDKNISRALKTFSLLLKIAPVYFVSGNHEMRSKRYGEFSGQLKEIGVIVPENETVELCSMHISGLNCAFLKNNAVFSVVPKDDGYKILLAHEPQYLKKYAQSGVDLVFSGHVHGGQWCLPFTRIGFYAPGQGLLPKYTAGLYRMGKTTMIVSRGLGNSEFPIRLFNRPEVVAVQLSDDI